MSDFESIFSSAGTRLQCGRRDESSRAPREKGSIADAPQQGDRPVRLLAAVLAGALPFVFAGCLVPTEYTTDMFADVWDDQLVVVLNLGDLAGEQRDRFAIYRSGERRLDEWRLVGVFAGHVRSAAVRNGELWAFFDGGFARTYRVADGGPSSDGGRTNIPGRSSTGMGESVGPLPFSWTVRAACRDQDGVLWAVGEQGGRIAVARLASQDPAAWETDLPPGPPVFAPRAGGEGHGAGSPREAGDGAPRGAREAGSLRLRARACGDLFVFWSVSPAGGGPARQVRAARFVRAGKDPLLRGPYWGMMPSLRVPHEDFGVAPGTGSAPGLVLRKPVRGWRGKRRRAVVRIEFDPSGRDWGSPDEIPVTDRPLRFGYVAGLALVGWGSGELLLRSNTQRVEIMQHEDGRWQVLQPAGGILLHLAEIQVLLLAAAGLFLVVAGGTAFATRLARIRRGEIPTPSLTEPTAPRPAPVTHRALAALVDFVLVVGAVLWGAGLPDAAESPVAPGLRVLLPHLVALAALVVYGTVLEATFGATLGKLVAGLRVRRVDGGPPHLWRVIVRNLLRVVDISPPYTGALGLGFIAITGRRQRLGDLAAGTVVTAERALSGPRGKARP